MGDDVARMAMIAEGMKYAVIIVSSQPVMCLYPRSLIHFIKGFMIGSIKGCLEFVPYYNSIK